MPRGAGAVLLCGEARAPLAAIGRELAHAGVPLLIQAAAPHLAEARQLCRVLGRGGAGARVVAGRLGGEAESRRIVAAAWRAAGAVAAVVICPALPAATRAVEPELADWQAGLDAGLRAPFFLAKHAGARLRRAGGGQLVFAIGGAPPAAGAVAGVVRAGLLCMVEALARALPESVAVGAVVDGRRGAARAAAAETARAVAALIGDARRRSGTVVALGER